MKKLVFIAALMISAFSFGNERNSEIIVEQNVQNNKINKIQATETIFLSSEELLTYCWTSVRYFWTGRTTKSMSGELLYEYEVVTTTYCITV